MPRFVIDEDMPRSTGKILREHGYDVKDIRDYGFVAQQMKKYTSLRKKKGLWFLPATGISAIF